jgi:hypothetical protein
MPPRPIIAAMPKSLDVHHGIRVERRAISVDETIRRLATRQHGVVGRAQLVELGIGPAMIGRLLAARRMEVVYRGVYALSRDLLSREGRWLAAVMATGSDAALSHEAAAAHWRIRPGPRASVDVVTPRRPRPRPGIRLHCLSLSADEVIIHDGIPVTTPARTIFDLAATLDLRALQRAVRETEHLRLSAGPSLPELVARYPGRTGVPQVRALIAAGDGAHTRSDLEDRFLDLVDRAGLPPPEVNALVEVPDGRFEVDCLWRRAGLVVELDGFGAHGTRFAFEADRRRDRLLQLAGFDVWRVTYRQVRHERPTLLRDLRSRLVPQG